jgi:hypothetical protein
MKELYKILIVLLVTTSTFAQAPEKMSYQAVLRDANNNLLLSTEVGIQISILQTTISGTALYTETQTSTTNINGLLSIEIGSGISSYNFSAVDWSVGPYFIKTEIDPSGGNSYSITGTSQIMSVPFAMYAKTSGSSETNATNINNNTTAIALNTLKEGYTEAAVSANTNVAANTLKVGYTEAAVSANTAVAANTAKVSPTVYNIGDFAMGGIVFWLDETGQHGLVCAKEDQDSGSGVRWYAGAYGNTHAKGDGLYAGRANTTIIIAAQVAIGDDGSTYAARICNELEITEGGITYGGWYLPSKAELNEMYLNRTAINSTAIANSGSNLSIFSYQYYWSSTEIAANSAWKQHFDDGVPTYNNKANANYVRAVRAF